MSDSNIYRDQLLAISPMAQPQTEKFTALHDLMRLKGYQKSLGSHDASERYVPPEMRGLGNAGGPIEAGLQGIGDMIRHPGRGATLKDIQPRLNSEYRNINQNYQGLASEQAGAAARGNVPVSIKAALQKALGTNQARAKEEAGNQALMESDQLKQGDLGQTYNLLDTILQFISSGKGAAIPGVNAANAMNYQAKNSERAGNTALIGSLLQAYGGSQKSPVSGGGGEETLASYLDKYGGMV